ncbi:MAG: metallopeptidase family protein [Phycisphaerales bacterium]|nr:metallopeptidase family protein [Phycisphaerales bacterium]
MIRVSPEEFDAIIAQALDSIPAHLRPYLENVLIEAAETPDPRLLEADDLPEDLLGLYIGASIENAAAGDGPLLPDRVLIFRRNLCEMCESREELADEIRITVLHEIGHHFGLDEEALDELGYG